MPDLADLGDSARLAAVLQLGANPHAFMTRAELDFGKDGQLRRVDVRDARSSSARAQIRDTIRAVVKRIGTNPRDLTIHLVRVNETGRVRLLAETATCEPVPHMTPEGAELMRQLSQDPEELRRPRRDAVVMFILEADGQVGDASIEISTGYRRADSLVIILFRAMRFDPAIVGQTPVSALVRQPFKF